MEEWLHDRLQQGKDYQRQKLDEDDNFNDEEDKDDADSPAKENISGILFVSIFDYLFKNKDNKFLFL